MSQETSSNIDVKDVPQFKAVMNHEEQYSIWPATKANPAGWTNAGFSGSKEACLNFIKETWTDMRPLSLRRAAN